MHHINQFHAIFPYFKFWNIILQTFINLDVVKPLGYIIYVIKILMISQKMLKYLH